MLQGMRWTARLLDHAAPPDRAIRSGAADARACLAGARGAAPRGAQGQGTALFRAAENGHAETVGLLLEKGARIDARKQVSSA